MEDSLRTVLFPRLRGRYFLALCGRGGYGRAVLARSLKGLEGSLRRLCLQEKDKLLAGPFHLEISAPSEPVQQELARTRDLMTRESFDFHLAGKVYAYSRLWGSAPPGFVPEPEELPEDCGEHGSGVWNPPSPLPRGYETPQGRVRWAASRPVEAAFPELWVEAEREAVCLVPDNYGAAAGVPEVEHSKAGHALFLSEEIPNVWDFLSHPEQAPYRPASVWAPAFWFQMLPEPEELRLLAELIRQEATLARKGEDEARKARQLSRARELKEREEELARELQNYFEGRG